MSELRARLEAGLEADRHTPGRVSQGVVETLDSVKGNPRSVALRCLVTGHPSYRSAFAKLMTNQPHLITDDERQAVMRAQSVGTDTAGGFAVPFTLDPTMIGITASTRNPIRSIARNVTTVSES